MIRYLPRAQATSGCAARLTSLGVQHAQQLEDQRTRRQKTDRLDARALASRLEKYLGGNCHAMSLVAVPSVEEEQKLLAGAISGAIDARSAKKIASGA
jgi:hypothetical protein